MKLGVTWGGDSRYWKLVPEPTSPRGTVWQLERVCYLQVQTKVAAPRPGLYAAFFRVRQSHSSQLRFSTEWKADTAGSAAYLDLCSPREHHLRQPSAGDVSWSHCRDMPPCHRKLDYSPGQWYLLHIGNVLVRSGQQVAVSFGGANDWCNNLDVDFAAIAPIRLSWDIESVVWIGHAKGGKITASFAAQGDRAHVCSGGGRISFDVQAGMPYCVIDGGRGGAADEDMPDVDKGCGGIGFAANEDVAYLDNVGGGINGYSGGCTSGDVSPLSCLYSRVTELILEFSQPTLVGPKQHGDGDDGRWKGF